jgi:hypothetical protein
MVGMVGAGVGVHGQRNPRVQKRKVYTHKHHCFTTTPLSWAHESECSDSHFSKPRACQIVWQDFEGCRVAIFLISHFCSVLFCSVLFCSVLFCSVLLCCSVLAVLSSFLPFPPLPLALVLFSSLPFPSLPFPSVLHSSSHFPCFCSAPFCSDIFLFTSLLRPQSVFSRETISLQNWEEKKG